MPVPNRGQQAMGLGLVQKAKEMLEKALPILGAETEMGQAAMSFLQKVGKLLPDGALSPGIADSAMNQFFSGMRQEAPHAALLAALGQQGQPPAPGGGPPPGAMPPPPPQG